MFENAERGQLVADARDRVTRCLFESALTLTSIVDGQPVDGEVAAQLVGVIEQLDAALVELRSVALDRLLADRAVAAGTPRSVAGVAAVPDPVAPTLAGSTNGRRCLCRVADDDVFAYAMRGRDFFRASDHVPWAQERNGLLFSVRSGAPFARRIGNVFHDLESHVPLYYEPGQAGSRCPTDPCR